MHLEKIICVATDMQKQFCLCGQPNEWVYRYSELNAVTTFTLFVMNQRIEDCTIKFYACIIV